MQSPNLINLRIFLYACLIAGTIGCNQGEVATEENVEAVTPVTLTNVTVKPILETVELPATSVFLGKSTIKSATTGVVEKANINTGSEVKNGDLLFTIRTKEAIALGKGIQNDPGLQFNGIVNINSSTDGTVTSVFHLSGDNIQEGDELAVVAQQNSLVFVLEIPFEMISIVRNNRNCRILLPDSSIITGEISGMLAEMDQQAQTVRYMVKPVTNKKLPENLFARISLTKRSIKEATVLPKASVLGNETQTEFWVMKLIDDSTAVKTPVVKGFENSDEVEILEPGFNSSDRFLLTGGYGISDTAKVTIINQN